MTSFDDYGPPLRVEGGLRARSGRGAIGEQWWSKRFVAVLESFALGTRLTRGRAYARRGQVLSLEVAAGLVTASVQGSRPTPYAVTVALPAWSDDVWEGVCVALADDALLSAQLLAGELPAELEPALAGLGVPLFPTRLSDLRLRCSCPDAVVPCKHLAATFYLLAESFDDDPFRVLSWRGRDRDTLLDRLRELRGGAPASGSPRRAVGAAAALVDVAVPERPAWEVLPVPPLPVHPDLPADLLLRQLPDPPPELGPSVRERLQEMYEQMSWER